MEIKVGVFVCDCGTNIGGVVKVPEVVEYAKTLDDVVFAVPEMFRLGPSPNDNTGNSEGCGRMMSHRVHADDHPGLCNESKRLTQRPTAKIHVHAFHKDNFLDEPLP